MSAACSRRLLRQVQKCLKPIHPTLTISTVHTVVFGGLLLILLVVFVLHIQWFRFRAPEEGAEKSNAKRLAHLQSACKRLNNGGHTNLQPAFYLHSRNHSLLYCLVFKAATSSWFYNFNSWAGFTEYEIMHVDNLHLARKFYPIENHATLMNSMEHSYSFIIVRHPFERLISAYEDRLISMRNAYYTQFGRAIYKRYHPYGNGVVSFRDYVQYIIDVVDYNNSTLYLDIHWSPVNNLCTPCLARYDFIVKMETYDRDIEFLTKATGLEGKIRRAHINQARKETLQRLIEKYFSQITHQQLTELYRIYQIDFELFGYSAQTYFQVPKALA